MDAAERARLIAQAAVDRKAADVVVLHVGTATLVTDYFVLCSGNNANQVRAIADHILDVIKQAGSRPISTEGLDAANWVLLDYGDVVVHIMQPEQRDYYGLERLWGDAERVEFSGAPEAALVGRELTRNDTVPYNEERHQY